MTRSESNIPPGPAERYSPEQDLLRWIGAHFEHFGDIFSASIFGMRVYVTRDPRHAEHVLRRNWQNYVKGQAIKRIAFLLRSGLMVSEGALWKKQRRMIQPAFSRKVVMSFRDLMMTANTALLSDWEARATRNEPFNVTNDISHMVMEVVLRSIFGDDFATVAPYFSVLADEAARDLEFAQTFRSMGGVILQVAARRRNENRISEDILGLLMDTRERDTGSAMSDHQLVSEVETLVVAAHETTASTLNWIWYLLSQHREVEERLGNELEQLLGDEFPELDNLQKFTYTRCIIEEALRLYPAGWLMTRRALNDDRLDDYFVPAGTEIYIPPYFIQRNPKLWQDPDSFNPDRFAPDRSLPRHEFAMLPFSAGPRNCIGEFFARVEMQIHLMIIAGRLRLRYFERTVPELDVGVNLRSRRDFIMAAERKTPVESQRGGRGSFIGRVCCVSPIDQVTVMQGDGPAK